MARRTLAILPFATTMACATHPVVTSTQATSASVPSGELVFLQDNIYSTCQIDFRKVTPLPSAPDPSLGARDRDTLFQVAECLKGGPLKGQSIRLIGRVGARTASVQAYLAQLGVDPTKLTTSANSSLDDRVDVMLEGPSSP